jgi:hypothetical protein
MNGRQTTTEEFQRMLAATKFIVGAAAAASWNRR